MVQPLPDLPPRIAALEATLARTRHDVRSALAPALLAADMLHASTDPRVRRSAATVRRSIERVLEVLDATRETMPAGPHEPPDRP